MRRKCLRLPMPGQSKASGKKGPGCSEPHHPHVLRPNRRPHALACPPLAGPAAGGPEHPANDGRRIAVVASYCTTAIAGRARRARRAIDDASLGAGRDWDAVQSIRFHLILRTSSCPSPASFALRTAPLRAASDMPAGVPHHDVLPESRFPMPLTLSWTALLTLTDVVFLTKQQRVIYHKTMSHPAAEHPRNEKS